MTWKTHRAVGACTATGCCVVTDLSLSTTLVVVAMAVLTSTLPDRIEGPLGAHHRTWTHWPVLWIALACLVAVVGPVAAVEVAGHLSDTPGAVGDVRAASGPLAAMVALGFGLGAVMHCVGDACTVGGCPLLGPAVRRDVWVLPRALRFRVYRQSVGLLGRAERQKPSVADVGVRWAMMAGTLVLAVAQFSNGAVA